MITKLHHISAITKSAEAAIYFYSDVLGLRLVKNTVNQTNTKMRHLFFGDYLGSPGSLLTFFEIPRAGHGQAHNNYFSTTFLAIPKGSLTFWQQRLAEFQIDSQLTTQQQLHFSDQDGFKVALVEVAELLPPEKATIHTAIPASKQIIRLLGTSIVAEKPTEALNFFTDFLSLKPTNETLIDRVRGDFTQITKSQDPLPSRLGRGTIDHIAYSVDTANELEVFYQKALAMKLEIEEYVDRGYFKSLYIKEPNGLRIEIATAEPGFLIDEGLEHLGEKLALPDFLEPNRKEIENKLEEL